MNEQKITIRIRGGFDNKSIEDGKTWGYSREISLQKILISDCDNYDGLINGIIDQIRSDLIAGFNQYVNAIKEDSR